MAPVIAIAAEPNPSITVGTVFGSQIGQNINGWRQMGGGLYLNRSTANYVTTEFDVCCYAVFQKENTYLIARTVAVAKREAGGVIAERVLGTKIVNKRPTENVVIDCLILWIRPAFNLYDTRTKIIRSVIISGDEFVTISWSDPGNYCDLGD